MPRACSIRFETPTKGHMPRKYVRTKLCVTAADMNISISVVATFLRFSFHVYPIEKTY